MQTLFGFPVPHTLLFHLLFDAVVKVTLLIVVAGVGTLLLKGTSAATRHFAWRIAFGGVMVMFAATLLLPLITSANNHAAPVVASVPVWRAPGTLHRVTMEQPPAQRPAASASTTIRDIAANHTAGTSTQTLNAPAATPGEQRLLLGITLGWLSGALLMLMRFGTRLRVASLLKRHSRTVTDERLRSIAAQAAEQMRLKTLPRLLAQREQAGVFSPVMWGWRRPCILLPFEAQSWPDTRLDAVLRHELAHVRRGDWIAQRCADALCALLWFNPLVWLAARQLRATAEQACDDATLTHGVTSAVYAQHLLEIARLLRSAPSTPAATLPFLSRLPLEARVRAILDPRANRRQIPPAAQKALTGLATLCLLPTALIVPTISRTLAAESNAPVHALNNKATLLNGVTVEVIGVADDVSIDRSLPSGKWWRPDGQRIAIAPYKASFSIGRMKDSWIPKSDFYRTVNVRISGLRSSYIRTKARISFETMLGLDDRYPTLGGLLTHLTKEEHNRFTMYDSAYIHVPPGTKQCTFHYGVTCGPWTDVLTTDAHPYIQRRVTPTSEGMLPPERETFNPKTDRLIVEFTDKMGDVPRRIIGYTKTGKAIRLEIDMMGVGTDESLYSVALPPHTLHSDFAKYQVQTCPYTWAEFPDIALQPDSSR